MTKYKCELCLKDFKQKIDYTRHVNKKNACVSVEELRKLDEKKQSDYNDESRLTTLFNSCMNILRDNESLTGEKALRNLSYLLVLRIMEPMIGKEIDFKNYEFNLGDKEKYREPLLKLTRFSKLAKKKTGDLPTNLRHIWTLILGQHPKTKDIFVVGKGFDIQKQTTFKKLIDKLMEFDFTSVSVDIQGHAYEDLLKDIMTGKVLGQFFTQPLVKDMMMEIIDPQVYEDGTIETVFDPAMGTGGFLMSSLNHVKKRATLKGIELDWDFITSQGLGGRETEAETFNLANANMFMSSGHMFTTLERGDSIRDPITGKYDIVLANPPFGIKGLAYREITSHLRDSYMPVESKSAVPLFLQAIISMLKVGGRGAMVMPDGQELFGKNKAHVALREYLMKTCDLKAVYFLPSGVFSNTSIKTCVIYFHKKKEGTDVLKIGAGKNRSYKFSKTHQTSKVKFYDYNPYEKVKNLLIEVDVSTLAENKYSLNYAEYLEEEEEEVYGDVEWKKLGDVCEINQGHTLTKKMMIDGDIDVIGGGKIIGKHNTYNREIATTVLTRVGDINVNFFAKPFFLTDNGFSLTGNTMTSTKYMFYYLQNNKDVLRSSYNGTAQKVISKTNLKNLKIPVPPLAIQKKIVEKLDLLYDSDIENSQTKIESLKKKRVMFVEAMTMGVESKKLGAVCEVDRNIKKHDTSHGIPNGKFKFHTGGARTDLYVNQPDFVDEWYIIQNRTNGAGKCNLYIDHTFSLAKQTIVYKAMTTIETKYIYYYLYTNIHLLETGFKGSGHKNISKDFVKNINIPVPPLTIQKKIVEQCERYDTLIADLENDVNDSKQLAKMILTKSIRGDDEDDDGGDDDEDDEIIILDDSDSE